VEDIPELYNLETVEQLRAIADPLRVRIVDALSQRALTATGLGEALGLPANKAHYHVRELEKVGLVRLVETREKGGILEKYYRAVAKTLDMPATLLQTVPPDESIVIMSNYLQHYTRGFLRAFTRALRMPDGGQQDTKTTLVPAYLWMTDQEYRDAGEKMYALLNPYRYPRGIAGEREHAMIFSTYDTSLDRPEGDAHETKISLTHDRPNTAAGVLYYWRRDLEDVVARGEKLDLDVLGLVVFADDIPADLADRAVARFRHRGVLRASPAVRDVLARKREEV